MARRTTKTPSNNDFVEKIVDVDVADEMQGSFLEYAYSVIYSRALPDARDGLKPVHRRILFQMDDMGLRPDRGHVKSARVVGEVMGKLHPHGDTAIYDALVRMAQPFAMRVPLINGHGNFGSLDAGPAAMRYTECRLDAAAMLMTGSIDEDVVDFGANYDGQLREPEVLPAAFPNLLVNGAAGIAVGMATNMAPHNLGEVIAAARHLIKHPKATLDDLMRFVPGPDLPTGGKIVGLDGVRDAYATGRGSFRIRATTRVENVTPRRKGIVVTELPYGVGPERVIEKISDLVKAKKLQGISDLIDLTDHEQGLRVVIEIKNGFNPDAVLEDLYRLTPMEDSFGINNVALVDGQPRTLGLSELLHVYVNHRLDVVRRRSLFRRQRAKDRLHLVDGLLIAIIDIDEVIQLIRTSDDTAQARARLIDVFDLTEIQTNYILEMPLRRLTKFSRIELETERDELQTTIDELTIVLDDESRLRDIVSTELADVAKKFATARRTVLLESAGQPATTLQLEVSDDPCWVLLSATGLLARTADDSPLPQDGERVKHDVVLAAVRSSARGEVGVVTSRGQVVRLQVLDLPSLPNTARAPNLAGGATISEFVELERGERALTLASLDGDGPAIALGTAAGIVKRVTPDLPSNKDRWEVIGLKSGDTVIGACSVSSDDDELVFITSDAQLLRFSASSVRPQGRPAGGMVGVRLTAGATAIYFGAAAADRPAAVVTVAGHSDALPGTDAGSFKVTDFDVYPAKGRGTGGVRCHRLLKGEDVLLLAWAGATPARAAAASGVPVDLPEPDTRRDGSGVPAPQPIAAVAGPV
ncbi:MAG TPA: DNA topoisomerase IV subunit A [Actinomycetes bacterium]|nr:DNA topoisomerase IV subunit A [Actinomycetes bacterium]